MFSNNEFQFTIDNREIECYSYPNIDRGWKFSFAGDGLVGMPDRLRNSSSMIIADRSGQLVVLNPELHHLAASPRPVPHAVYRLSEGSPSGRPIILEGELIFVPLTDGTVALVPIKNLPEPPR